MDHQPQLFVSNLNLNFPEECFKHLFTPFGDVRECFLIKTWQNTHAGYGFVRFATNEQATLCFNCLNGSKVFGTQQLNIQFTMPM